MDLEALRWTGLRPSLRRRDAGQVSHGLNLVLRLKRPAEMPLLLAKIGQAQRKINAGLGELNFVHFARFLPTPDQTALQVITEFDGPLAPYVLDFAIEIGDVFDMLLSHTQGTERIVPIAEHAAEFLAFVEKNNTVNLLPGLPGLPGLRVPDWPLYAAYPEQTVLDITGPRSDLPVPKADRWATEVDRDDVQGNLLRGFGADRVRHFLLSVSLAREARAWLAGTATPGSAVPAGVPKVTSGAPWPAEAKPVLMLNIGLTFSGLQALGLRDGWTRDFPQAFQQGALQRAEGNFDVGSNAPEHWWLGGPAQAASSHVMVSMYARRGTDAAALEAAAQALLKSLPGGGLRLMESVDGFSRDGKSWLGYIDGLAHPRIATACPEADEPRDVQPASTAGEFVLGAGYRNIYGGSSLGGLPAALASNGSFCAVRVLAQNVEVFDKALKDEATRLNATPGLNATLGLHATPDWNVTPDWLAAKLMGRWYEGAPVSLHAEGRPQGPPEHLEAENKRNDFDFAPSYEYPGTLDDHAGERCPVGAHIRRSNPRTARVAGARYTRRLLRRGMSYERKDADGQRQEVGLFGLFFCADLERQFEFIQRAWLNGDRFAAGLRGTRDPFAGTPGDQHGFEIPMPAGAALHLELPQFVHTKGSLYLFMPGLKALRQMERFATEPPPAPTRPTVVAAAVQAGAAGLEDSWRSVLTGLQAGLTAGLTALHYQRSEKHGQNTLLDDLMKIALASVGNPPGSEPATAPATPAAPSRVMPLQNMRFDPRRRDFQIDPYPVYAAFRAKEPVHYSPLYDGWFVFSYAGVVQVCTEDANFSAAQPGSKAPRGLFTLDNPEHAPVRAAVAQAWNSAMVMAEASVQTSLNRALAALENRPCFDLVDDFARAVPRDVYFDILGGADIGADERLTLDRLARTVMKHHDHTLDALQRWNGTVAGLELATRLAGMLAKAAVPVVGPYRHSFLGQLAKQVDWLGLGARPISLVTAVATLVNLTVAGYMSVEFLLATGIRRLLLNRRTGWEAVKAGPETLPNFLREMRRTEHALSVIDRHARADVNVGGVLIPKGSRVFGVLASANRDEAVFGLDADDFKPDRCSHPPHLGLGRGAHVCMGVGLEEMITEPTLNRLMTTMPGLRLRSDAQPPWFENFYFRAFDHLPVMKN